VEWHSTTNGTVPNTNPMLGMQSVEQVGKLDKQTIAGHCQDDTQRKELTMGADFTYAIIPLCKLTPERREEATNLIANGQLREGCCDSDDPEDVKDERDRVQVALDDYLSFLDSRDTCVLQLKGTPKYLITGGMSWGDSPTDTYDAFLSLENIEGLWDLLEQWAREDMPK
jgi:hypothetical protein